MSKEFIEKRIGKSSIAEAVKQQKQLSYFTQSEIQQPIVQKYLEQWANRNYSSSPDFLNWVKTVFKSQNFLSFYKYLRFPLVSAELVNDRIKPQLARVFFSEDSFFKYTIAGEEVQVPDELDSKEFNEWIFNALLFRHNDIIITDLKDINTPFRELLSIDNVVALESHRSIIHRLAFNAVVPITKEDGTVVEEKGFLYMDKDNYIFYDEDLVPILTIPHDLEECPADYVSREAFAGDDIIRKSIFSYVKNPMEEYVFLNTLLRMTEPNGAIPVSTQLKTKQKEENQDFKGKDSEPMSSNQITGQRAETASEVTTASGLLQTGTEIKFKPPMKTDGSLDMDAVKNFITFHYMPVEALEYVNKRIKEVKKQIVVSLLGEMGQEQDQNLQRRNELDVKSGFVSAEDKIRGISLSMSRIRQRSDFKFLALEHGRDRVTVDTFYGSDFFLETQGELYELFEKSPNPLERKNILQKLARNRNRFNKDKGEREVILNHLIPYVADKDFEAAVERNAVDSTNFQYQTRFNYWIGIFEAEFGDILLFWESMGDDSNSTKLLVINNIIVDIINKAIVPIVEPVEGD